MTRVQAIEQAVKRLLQEKSDEIEDRKVTTVQIQVRLYPNGGLPSKILLQTSSEYDL